LSDLVKRFPTLSLFVLALAIGGGVTLLVLGGVAPPWTMLLAALSASLAGIALTAVADGSPGLRRLFGELLVWRVGVQWWLFALLFLAPVTLAGAWMYGFLGGPGIDASKLKQLHLAVPGLLMLTVLAGLGEELGWRGFLQRRLQSRHGALVSSIIIGASWALWHAPMFFMDIEGLPYNSLRLEIGFLPAMLGFMVYLIAWSVQYTWIYNNTRGSLLLMCVLHGSELWVGFLVGVDDARFFFYGLTPVMVLTSAVIVVVFGPRDLSRGGQRQAL